MNPLKLTVPVVCDCDEGGESGDPIAYAALEGLLNLRCVFVFQAIDDSVAKSVIAQLMLLEAVDPTKDINMVINCPGGSVTATLAIYDAMQKTAPDIAVSCVGRAYSGGAFLLMAGTKGKRRMTPNASVLIHQMRGHIGGDYTDMGIEKAHADWEQTRMAEIIARHTGQSAKKVMADTERDLYLQAENALAYGLVDGIDTTRGWFLVPKSKKTYRSGGKKSGTSTKKKAPKRGK